MDYETGKKLDEHESAIIFLYHVLKEKGLIKEEEEKKEKK